MIGGGQLFLKFPQTSFKVSGLSPESGAGALDLSVEETFKGQLAPDLRLVVVAFAVRPFLLPLPFPLFKDL